MQSDQTTRSARKAGPLMRAVSGAINITLFDFEKILFAHLARRNV